MTSAYYQKVLEYLRPYTEKVAYLPLSELEVLELEIITDHSFPAFYREYLTTFGLLQDLVFGLLTRSHDFVTTRDLLPQKFWTEYIVVGDNGGEDCWLLRADATNTNAALYECQHWDDHAIVPLDLTFAELLENGLRTVQNEYSERLLNSQKVWSVQLNINTTDEQKLLTTLQAVPVEPWQHHAISSAAVVSSRRRVRLPHGDYTITRQEYEFWETPAYYLNVKDSFIELQAGNSLIRTLDRTLKATFKTDYTLIDYGCFMPIDLEDEE